MSKSGGFQVTNPGDFVNLGVSSGFFGSESGGFCYPGFFVLCFCCRGFTIDVLALVLPSTSIVNGII